jgi:hypothetical protein
VSHDGNVYVCGGFHCRADRNAGHQGADRHELAARGCFGRAGSRSDRQDGSAANACCVTRTECACFSRHQGRADTQRCDIA